MSATYGWTFSDIQQKVRNITGTPSTDQMSDAELGQRINNYIVFSMPNELKPQIDINFLDFKTIPGNDIYSFPGTYLTDSPGAYADGFPLVFYQDPDIFYQDWPQQYAVDNLATGDGTTVSFSGGLQNPPVVMGSLFITDGTQVLQDTGSTEFSGLIASGSGSNPVAGTLPAFPIVAGSMTATDGNENFTDDGFGNLDGSLGGTGTINYTTGVFSINFATAPAAGVAVNGTFQLNSVSTGMLVGDGSGTINYVTGAYSVTFNSPPAATATIYAKYIGYQGNRPQGILFFNNQFTMRPVPDQVYQIRMQGFVKPTILVNDTDTLPQEEWGILVAYGTALEVFADRGDWDSWNKIFPSFKRYESVAMSRTVQQYTTEQSVPRF